MRLGGLTRLIGVFVILTALAGAALVWLAVVSRSNRTGDDPEERILFGVWRILYDSRVPETWVLLAALAVALFTAAAVAALELRASNRARRSFHPRRMPLAPRVIMDATRGVFQGPLTVTVLIPAHNEETSLPRTLASLASQHRPPDRVIVIADNCTDDTVGVARRAGVDVFETRGNAEKKAGALNQVLAEILPGLGWNDTVLIMDADTELSQSFLDGAARRLENDRGLSAVGGLFSGEEGHGLIGQFQRNEYIRYSREISRRRGRVFVLTGTATVFRARALATVAESRSMTIPGITGNVYDTSALTEDNELTIALKSLGALMISPPECTVVTELMPNWRMLWAQRLRWQRGALENIAAYGMTQQTLRYWSQQFAIGYSVVALGSFFLLMVLTILAVDAVIVFPFWLSIGTIFIIERVVTVWRGGWRARALAVLLIPELLFDLFLDAVYLKGVADITFGRKASWKHVTHTDAPATTASNRGGADA